MGNNLGFAEHRVYPSGPFLGMYHALGIGPFLRPSGGLHRPNFSPDVVLMRCSFLFVSFCVLLSALAGCGGSGVSTPPVQISVTIAPTSATVSTGNSQQFTAGVFGTSNTGVAWSVGGGASNGTISSTGLYTAPATVPNPAQVTVTVASLADSSKTASAIITVQSAVSVQILPQTVTLQVTGTQQFSATVMGSTDQTVTWSVLGGNLNGGIDGTGFYRAPGVVPNPPQVTIQATSQANTTKSGTATVTVIAATPSITVTPNPWGVANFDTQQFNAVANNLSSSAVTWQVNGITGGSQQSGFISPTGLYVAPGGVPTKSTGTGKNTTTPVTITAVSQVDPTVSGSAIVTISPLNRNALGSPIYLGTSGGNQKDSQTSGNTITCCSGTLGSVVTRGGILYILSNNHVLARSDLGTKTNGSVLGDNIIQPGLIDSQCGQGIFDFVANLSDFYNLETGTAPVIDAAIAQGIGNALDPNGNILYLGATTDGKSIPLEGAPHAGTGVPATSALLTRAVAKSGRTTGLTCSTVFSISTTASIQYQKGCGSGTTFNKMFSNQIAVQSSSFSAPGDSGSLIVTQDTADPVALLFAGSDQDTLGNPVADVLNHFGSAGNAMTFVGGNTHQVIGCTLPTAPASAVLAVPIPSIASQALQKATTVRDANAPQLMSFPEVRAVGVGASLDHPQEPAIVFFIAKGQPGTGIPREVEGISTRIVELELFAQSGVLTVEQTAALEQSAGATQSVYPISESEFARVRDVHAAHVAEWMSKTGVQGVGIGSSADSPGEAALVIFLIRGVAHEPVPSIIDGVRTRIHESSRFRAGFGDERYRTACSLSLASPTIAKSRATPTTAQ